MVIAKRALASGNTTTKSEKPQKKARIETPPIAKRHAAFGRPESDERDITKPVIKRVAHRARDDVDVVDIFSGHNLSGSAGESCLSLRQPCRSGSGNGVKGKFYPVPPAYSCGFSGSN